LASRRLGEGRFVEALEEAMKAPKSHPNYYYAVVLCGQIRHLLGDLVGAEGYLDRAIRISQKRPEAFTERARLRADQRRIEEGVEDALRARELIPEGDKLEADVRELLELLYSQQAKR
jgi:tetratricopeptide (TPR) repeat protein